MADRETELREQLAALHRRYHDEGAPIIEELTKIEAMKPRAPMIYADLLPGLARQGYVSQVLQDLAAMIDDAKAEVDKVTGVSVSMLSTGISAFRHKADGTVERVNPEDFYAKPESEQP